MTFNSPPKSMPFERPGVTPAREHVVLPGGTLTNIAQSPDIEVFEHLWSAEPNEAWYAPERSPQNPTTVPIAAYKVPSSKKLLITDYYFEAYRQSALVAHGSSPLGPNELRGQAGYKFSVKGRMPGVTRFEIEPVPSIFGSAQFRDPGLNIGTRALTPGDFARKRANSYGLVAGVGLTLLPPRLHRHGDIAIPGVFAVDDTEQVTMDMVIYRPIGFPLTLIEGRIVGYLGARTTIDKLLSDMQDSLR
jgi:hypothetical protein